MGELIPWYLYPVLPTGSSQLQRKPSAEEIQRLHLEVSQEVVGLKGSEHVTEQGRGGSR